MPNSTKYGQRTVLLAPIVHTTLKWLYSICVPFTVCARLLNRKAPSFTYSKHNIWNLLPCPKCFGLWPMSWTELHGEWLCLDTSAFVNPWFIYSSSSVSANAMMRKRKSAGAIQSPCLTPTYFPMSQDNLPIFNFILMFLYSLLIVFQNFLGPSYLEGSVGRSSWFIVSKSLTRSVNTPHKGKLWVCLVCSIVFSVKGPSWQPTPGVEPNWYLALFF